VFRLADEVEFPDPALAEPDGLLAVGGDLTPARLVAAYASGIFPWYSEGQPILWWAPDPRFVVVPARVHVGRTLRRVLRRRPYEVTFDGAFAEVVERCAGTPRPGQRGTWITAEMRRAYVELHDLGLAHSVEAWRAGELVGGLYGVSLGAAFFGESMFAVAPDASKVAFAVLTEHLARWGFTLVDCQVETEHLARFGAEPWPLARFREALARAVERPTRRGRWELDGGVRGPG
jgi:leucyl/phenylalanyl-tRNA--protein transferase